MIELTEKETLLAQELINCTDGTDCHICKEDFIDIEKLNWNVDTLKGVFGSLVSKNLLYYVDENDNGEIYQWTIPVDSEQQCMKFDTDEQLYQIKTVDDLLFQFKKQREERA